MIEKQFKTVKGVWFGHNSDVHDLLVDFRVMVNYCIHEALRRGIRSYAKLRKMIYDSFKMKFEDYATHYCHSACRIALNILSNWRKRCRKGKASWNRPPRYKSFSARVELCLTKFYGDKLRITVRKGTYLWLDLNIEKYQKDFVEKWRALEFKLGEIIIKEKGVIIPFKGEVGIFRPEGYLVWDINETSLEGLIWKGGSMRFIRVDLREVYHIHQVYSEKRRRLQKLQKIKPLTAKRLINKYSKRESLRIDHLLHIASKRIKEIISTETVYQVFGDLTNIRENTNRKRRKWRKESRKKVNRRINRWNFRKIQFVCDYKALDAGCLTIYISEAWSSKTCPVCGFRRKYLRGQVFTCQRCGFTFDRHLNACLNMLKQLIGMNPLKHQMGDAPFLPTVTYEITPQKVMKVEEFDIANATQV